MSDASDAPSQAPPPSSGAVATGTWRHGRQYAIYMGNTLLGTSNLEYPVVPGQRLAGLFLLTPACAHIAWVFHLYSRAASTDHRAMLREYVDQRDRLRLELWDAGVKVDAIVELISTWPEGAHYVHVASADPRLWRPRLYPA